MATTTQHDLYALFAFCLSEGDWPLADLLASTLFERHRSTARLDAELARRARRPGSPATLALLRRWALMSSDLGLAGAAD
jgi:hypothetical protein